MKREALANLTAPSCQRTFSRKPNRRIARRDRRRVTQLNQMLHLARECLASAKSIGIDELKKDGGSPWPWLFRSAMAGKARREGFDD